MSRLPNVVGSPIESGMRGLLVWWVGSLMRSTMARIGFRVESAARDMGRNQLVDRGWVAASTCCDERGDVCEVEAVEVVDVAVIGGGLVSTLEGGVEVVLASTASCLEECAGAVMLASAACLCSTPLLWSPVMFGAAGMMEA